MELIRPLVVTVLRGLLLTSIAHAAVLQPNPVRGRELSAAEAEKHFTDALEMSGYDMSSFDGNITDLSTRLIGWEGCDSTERTMIYSGWQQSWKIMNLLYSESSSMNFNEAAAVEFLGPPSLNQPQQKPIKDRYVFDPFAWRIHVRCDDPKKKCPCGVRTTTVAYTNNKDPLYNTARINFCPLYFAQLDLDQAMRIGNEKSLGPRWYTDLENYVDNKGRTWIHELLHIDWVSKARAYGSNNRVRDLKLWVELVPDKDGNPVSQELDVYGPKMAKSLARWQENTGHHTIQNSDSLTMYAMARYVQKALGNIYPHLPLAPKPPLGGPSGGVGAEYTVADLFTMHPDGKATVINSTALDEVIWDAQCPIDDATDVETEAEKLTLGSFIATENDMPQEYLEQYRAWTDEEVGEKLTFKGVSPGEAIKPGTKLRILGVGDSITVGFLSERDGGDGNGYRLKLQQDLSKDEVVFVGTESAVGTMSGGYFAAWSGQTIQYISEHVAPSLEQRPNLILVHAGTNDMNPNLNIAKQGNDPKGAAERLGKLIDQIIQACPDATVLVAMIISTCDQAQQVNTAQYQQLIPGVVKSRRAAGKHVLAVDFTSFPTSSLRDCIHPTNQGYRDFGDYWYDFITQIPTAWLQDPVGDDPDRPTLPNIDANGGLDRGIPAPNWGSNPVQASSKSSVRTAALLGANGGERICLGGPVWRATGKIASGVGKAGNWQYQKDWTQVGKVADGLKLDSRYVRLHDMNGDGKADYVWLNPDNGEIRCWINNLPAPWSPAGTNDSIIGSGAGVAESVFLADMNGDGLEDYMVVNPQNGAVRIWWNYGPDGSWANGWKFVEGGQIASGVPHANWATLRFPDINGDGRADYVYIGAGGSLSHWMNTGTVGGQDVLFLSQGGIATGATSDISKLAFADMDGDGRDDYLIWDAQAGLTGFLNQPSRREGVPVYINQGPAKTIADGISQDSKDIRLADMNGDGKDDYAYIDKDGAIWLWYNDGGADTTMAIDGLRFADIDGDGIDDYVWLHPDTGAPTVFLNKGPTDDDALGWLWNPVNDGNPIASGAGSGRTVQFGDIDGDGRDDYLVLDPTTGELYAYLNKGPDASRAEKWRWDPIGSIATGLGSGANVRIADIDGDGYDDYIFLRSNGGTTIYRNVWETNQPPSSWRALPEADASGIGQRPEEIDFVDINGDGKADYVWTRPSDGAAKVWLNNYPNQPTWLEQPEIAGGVGVSGADVRYAVLQKTGRASYVAVDRTNGAIAAWLNGCVQLGDPPRPNVVLIGLREMYAGSTWSRSWVVFESTIANTVDVCEDKPKGTFTATTTLANPTFPTELDGFDVHGAEGCTYSGSRDQPGTMRCAGVSGIRCSQDSQHDEVFNCGLTNYRPMLKCTW